MRGRSIRARVAGFIALALAVTGSGQGAVAQRGPDLAITGESREHLGDGYGEPTDPDVTVKSYDDFGSADKRVVWLFYIDNPSDQTVQVDLRWAVRPDDSPGSGKYDWTARGRIYRPHRYGKSDRCDSDYRRCELTIEPHGVQVLEGEVEGWAPGPYQFDVWFHADGDPNSANNRFVGEGKVVCDQMGTPGDDVLVGTKGWESICGLGGNDVIKGLGYADAVWGGQGDDRIVAGPAYQALFAGGGYDTIDFTDVSIPLAISLEDQAANSAASKPDTNLGFSAWTLVGFEDVLGTPQADYIEGSARSNTLRGGGGPDELFGRGSRDILVGGPGKDRFHSRDGARDRIFGGRRADSTFGNTYDRILSSVRASTPLFPDQDPRA